MVLTANFAFVARFVASITLPKLPWPSCLPKLKISSICSSFSTLVWLIVRLVESPLPLCDVHVPSMLASLCSPLTGSYRYQMCMNATSINSSAVWVDARGFSKQGMLPTGSHLVGRAGRIRKPQCSDSLHPLYSQIHKHMVTTDNHTCNLYQGFCWGFFVAMFSIDADWRFVVENQDELLFNCW